MDCGVPSAFGTPRSRFSYLAQRPPSTGNATPVIRHPPIVDDELLTIKIGEQLLTALYVLLFFASLPGVRAI